jgi:flagellar motor component MotA
MAGIVVTSYIVLGSPPSVFINIPTFLVAVLVPLCLAVATFGLGPVLRALRATLALVLNDDRESIPKDAPRILNCLANTTYRTCAIGVLLGFIMMFHFWHDPSQVGPAIAVSILVPLYSLLMGEGLYRPAARRAAFLRALDHPAPSSTEHYNVAATPREN